MTTQTLRGLAHQGPMHWRGDRTGATFLGDPLFFDATLAFEAFNVAFATLLGRDEGALSAADMQAFTDFVLQIQPGPNAVRSLDNQLTAAQARGRDLFLDPQILIDPVAHCAGCHSLDASEGAFGTSGLAAFTHEPQAIKIPQLKNAYLKIGMFGTPNTEFSGVNPENAQYQGDQVLGVGFLHDGSMATVFDFLHSFFFTRVEGDHRVSTLTDDERRDLEQFVLAFDTTFAPIVAQQVTLTTDNAAVAGPRIDLLIARARTSFVLIDQPDAMESDLVARAVVGGEARGYLLDAITGRFQSDRAAEAPLTDAELRAVAADGEPVTYTCTPRRRRAPGTGSRRRRHLRSRRDRRRERS
jgi:hypothetical protein